MILTLPCVPDCIPDLPADARGVGHCDEVLTSRRAAGRDAQVCRSQVR